MINSATTPRNRAIVALLYDSGCRISEIGNLKIKHVVLTIASRTEPLDTSIFEETIADLITDIKKGN